MSIRKSPRIAAMTPRLDADPSVTVTPDASITDITRVTMQARDEQQERAELAISRIQANLLRAASTLPMVDPIEELYFTDRDKFFEEVEYHTQIQRLKFVKNLYIKRGIFQPCQDLIIPPVKKGQLSCILIKINDASYWLCGALILELRNENIHEPFFHIAHIWDDQFNWVHDTDYQREQ